jgi:hypothetical protein
MASAALMMAAPDAAAQMTRVTLRDSSEVAASRFQRLFVQVDLTREGRRAAESAILRAFVASQEAAPITSQEKWNRILAIQAHRDSILIGLEMSAADRERLKARLAADRPRSSRWKSDLPPGAEKKEGKPVAAVPGAMGRAESTGR